MTISYKSGRRIQGTQADFDGTPAVSGGWKELGRTTWSSGNSFTVSNIPDKRYLMVLNYTDSASNYNNIMRFNSDSGTNYAWRRSMNGESPDGTTKTNTTNIGMNAVGYDDFGFSVNYIANLSGKEKLVINQAVDAGGVGASSAPDRQEVVGKWIETDPIDEITVTTTSANYNLGETVVLGYDPDDTHTDNFWEELASVELGSDGDTLSSGTITAKKYLWVQAAIMTSSAGTNVQNEITFNNNTTGNNYAQRYSYNGTSDIDTLVSRNNWLFSAGSNNKGIAFLNFFIINNSANEKLCIGHAVLGDTAGAGTIPKREEAVAKWANTSSQITEIDIDNTLGSIDYKAGSFLKVWGSN